MAESCLGAADVVASITVLDQVDIEHPSRQPVLHHARIEGARNTKEWRTEATTTHAERERWPLHLLRDGQPS